MADAGFRLPGSSYEELANIIMAYGTRDEASNPGDVSKLDSVHRSSVTRTNGFLVEIGVLRGEREKLVTKRGRELALALERRDKAEVRRNWRVIVSTSEFLQNVVSAVKLREGMEYTMTQAYIAHSAGQPRNKPVMIGASTVVEILKTSGLLREDEAGRLSATYADDNPENEPPVDEGFLETPDLAIAPEGDAANETPEPSANASANAASNPTLNIHLHVRCDADELEDVAPRLKRLIRDFQSGLPDGASVRGEAKEVPSEGFRDGFARDFLEENANPPVFEEEFEGDFR
ncbi:MAG: hypothetical protein H0U65_13970 [Rubrobacter sp.]|jgi:hypothetical protein|nr:hypothetical protein [Rubrobacter sp.]